ncbi:xylose isomerase [Thioclava sp. SK-1]|uniref:TIM barrel protein n=1 Tax=Thioclava sp. SK-1 TaxID=1889770 RepID=UPI000824F112|nr:TIM barrel protein [Thioclava sp. SK-1]OCX65147.1 xylose isomerase [Thioclava sp. SK-1]
MRFALNHICAPKLPLGEFMAMCCRLGISEIEIRNDIPDVVGTMDPAQVKHLATEHGVTILSINALYPFNVWSGDLPDRAIALADYAQACGAQALVMCPLNDATLVSQADLIAALKAMKPILDARGLIGLVEPLGFPVSSLRAKAVALDAIAQSGGQETYRLLHDTFHHHLASETGYAVAQTGMVHISGVTDPDVAVDDMLDAHRVLVDEADRLENIAQLRDLLAQGYSGPISLEPFSDQVHALDDPETALATTLHYLRSALARETA